MEITLIVQLNIEGTRSIRGGSFPVIPKEFKDNPDFTAAVIAYQFIQDCKKETGYRDTLIEKVIYNGEKDITEIVRGIRPITHDDLPF